jgi:hypothetical protein
MRVRGYNNDWRLQFSLPPTKYEHTVFLEALGGWIFHFFTLQQQLPRTKQIKRRICALTVQIFAVRANNDLTWRGVGKIGLLLRSFNFRHPINKRDPFFTSSCIECPSSRLQCPIC